MKIERSNIAPLSLKSLEVDDAVIFIAIKN
jgi:hypothetical protein